MVLGYDVLFFRHKNTKKRYGDHTFLQKLRNFFHLLINDSYFKITIEVVNVPSSVCKTSVYDPFAILFAFTGIVVTFEYACLNTSIPCNDSNLTVTNFVGDAKLI